MRILTYLSAVSLLWWSACNGCNTPSAPSTNVDAAAGACGGCATGLACRYDTCVPAPTACAQSSECTGDTYCDLTTNECLPYGIGPGGDRDPACKRDPVPGVFLPGLQCEWVAPPDGDPYPDHTNVLTTPMVALFYNDGEFASPSIVFTTYNYTDGGAEAAQSSNPNYFGVIRIISGASCQQLATLATPTVVASANLALGDVGGDDATPEIIAARSQGGLVAWTKRTSGTWEVLWETTSTFHDTVNNWAGPSLYDLNDDGKPEALLAGNVYDGATGAAINEAIGTGLQGGNPGFIPVVADLDGDNKVELLAGTRIYQWNTTTNAWDIKQALAGGVDGFSAAADFGTYGDDPAMDDRATLDGMAEIVNISAGTARIHAQNGRLLFVAGVLGGGAGGPPTIADFDGDGRAEFAAAGSTAYTVFDPDCGGAPNALAGRNAICASGATNGILWSRPSQDSSSNRTGSSVFDFEGDGRAEAVYGDECFTRVYDGTTGNVVYSQFRRSCTWYENPVIADVDSDFNAEIISTSNTNCPGITCPAVDPIFPGVQCMDDADCPGTTGCHRETATDTLGLCRCTLDADCGGSGFVCVDPIAGPSTVGKVCRASNPGANSVRGLRVLADNLDRWVRTRPIWNQHAYSVTNVSELGIIAKTSQWLANWKQAGLNNFRQNTPGTGAIPGAMPDLTIKMVNVACPSREVTLEVCNRGNEPVAAGVPVALVATDGQRANAITQERVYPAACITTKLTWTGADGTGHAAIDVDAQGKGRNTECREDNNQLALTVSCP